MRMTKFTQATDGKRGTDRARDMGHKRTGTGTWTQMDGDKYKEGQGPGHRRTGTGKQTNRDIYKDQQGQGQRWTGTQTDMDRDGQGKKRTGTGTQMTGTHTITDNFNRPPAKT